MELKQSTTSVALTEPDWSISSIWVYWPVVKSPRRQATRLSLFEWAHCLFSPPRPATTHLLQTVFSVMIDERPEIGLSRASDALRQLIKRHWGDLSMQVCYAMTAGLCRSTCGWKQPPLQLKVAHNTAAETETRSRVSTSKKSELYRLKSSRIFKKVKLMLENLGCN